MKNQFISNIVFSLPLSASQIPQKLEMMLWEDDQPILPTLEVRRASESSFTPFLLMLTFSPC